MNTNISQIITTIQDQAPEVAKQMAGYAATTSLIWIIIAAIGLGLCVFALVKLRREDDGCNDAEPIVFALLVVGILACLIILAANASGYIEATFYPKALIAEKLLKIGH